MQDITNYPIHEAFGDMHMGHGDAKAMLEVEELKGGHHKKSGSHGDGEDTKDMDYEKALDEYGKVGPSFPSVLYLSNPTSSSQVCSCVAYLPFLTTVLIDGDIWATGMGADCWKGKKEDAENAGTKGCQDGIYLQQDGQGKRAPQNVSQMQSVRLHYHDKSSILT
jgi:hypothetical protein